MLRSIFLVICITSGLFGTVTAKHFRGGYMSWTPTGRPREVRLFFRLAYKHGFFAEAGTNEDGEDCSYDAIHNQLPVKTGGDFNCITTTWADGERVEHETELFDGLPPYYTCTNIRDNGEDPDLHWSSGYNETTIILPEHDPPVWSVGYDACCWLDTLINYDSPRTWRMRTKIDLSPRSDLGGRPNTSPYVEGLPLKTVAQHCLTSIPINAIDPDGDKTKCRWTNERKGECDSNCGNPDESIFTMREGNCTILVDAQNASPGLYAVAVLVEDYPVGRKRRQPFSKIPYQFLVNIQQRDVDCNRVVTGVPEQACYEVPMVIDPPFKINLHAETTEPSIPIVAINMITQPGMETSVLQNDGNGRYHVEVSWVPPSNKRGVVELLCYQAIDQEGITGRELCVKLFIGGRVPEPDPLISTPSSNESVLVNYDNTVWTLFFTEKVKLSGNLYNSPVVFLFENETIAHEVTIKEENGTVVGAEAPYNVTFTTPDFQLEPNTTYVIRLESGVVVGTLGCNLPSKKNEWNFTTEIFRRALPRPLNERFEDGVSVECLPTFMIAYIESELLPDVDPSILSYNDPDCYGVMHNETHFAIGTMYGKCGTEAIVNEDETRVSMINNLLLPQAGSFVYGDVLTRSENIHVRVNCSIPTRRVAYVEFNTNTSVQTVEKDATGDYEFSLKMFPDESYRKPYRVWDFPIEVQGNAVLYFEARTFERDFAPFLEECVATPTADPAHSLRYTLIRDGCAQDDSIIFHEASTSRVRFSVNAFSFIGYNLQSSVFVHCELRNCNPRNGSCDTNCPGPAVDPNRAKRGVSSLRVGPGDETTDGPIRIIAARNDGITPAEFILICLVSVVIAMIMLLSCLVAMVMQRANRTAVCANCSQKSIAPKLAIISTKTKI